MPCRTDTSRAGCSSPARRRAGLPQAAGLVWFVLGLGAALALAACGSSEPGPAATPPAARSPSPAATASAAGSTPSAAATAAATATPAQGRPFVPADSIDTEIKRLNVTVDGRSVNLKNGGIVDFGKGLKTEIFVDPYPPTTLRVWVDFFLTRDGEPVSDASMGIDYDMLAMVHGPFFGEAQNLGGGHYLFKLDYIMFGPWDQTVTIRLGLTRIRIPLVVVAHP